MDVEQLHLVLQQSFSPDATVRKPSEETIRNLKNMPGATMMLLQVAAEKQVRFEVRQAASIQLKNLCREGWAERIQFNSYPSDAKTPLLSEPDKEAVKQNLIQALLEEPEKSIRDLLAETLQTIIVHDFPEKWPNLIPNLLAVVQQGDNTLQVHNALLGIRKVVKRYEYKSKEQRGPLNEIVQLAFPLLLPLGQQLSDPNQHSLEAAMMLKQILKIFWSSTQFFLAQTDNLQPWFDILTAALRKPLPEASTGQEPVHQPEDVHGRNQWPWWKVKKWAVQIMSRLFSRYGIPLYADDDAGKEFADYFSKQVAPQFLGPICETLGLRPSGQFCTDRVVHLCLSFLDLAVELASTYKLLKPHLEFLLYQVSFPTLCLSPVDIECFENDPIEFVHKQTSPLADFYDPRQAAITLIIDLVKHRGQDVTQNLLGRMTEILHRYASAPADQRNHVEKDGALLTFGSLAKYLLVKDKYANEIEGLLVTSVFPDFTSHVSFLRYRACWMVQQYHKVKFSDDGTNLRTLIEMVLNRLSDPALPVQIEASKALRFLLEAEGAETTLLPVLPQLLQEYFRIMNEIGNDEVVSALQVLLDRFGDHIEPHAVALVNQLSNSFAQYCTAGEDDDDDDAALAAAQCLECIATVLKGVCGNQAMLQTLEPHLVPLVLKILGNEGELIEYLEQALDILTFLTFFQDQLSPSVWQAFPLIYVAFDQWAYDYLNMMVPCLQSYISKSPEVFLRGSAHLPEGDFSYIDLMCSMVAKTVSNERASESECRYALSLFMCILHHCPGQVNNYVHLMNDVALSKLGQQVNNTVATTRYSVYQVIGSALYYQPSIEVLELEKRGVTHQVMSKWIEDTENMKGWLPRKITVLGFSALMTIPLSSMPLSIKNIMPQIVHAACQLSMKMKQDLAGDGGDPQQQNPFDADHGLANESKDHIGDVDIGFNENEDVTNDVDEAYRQALQGATDWEEDVTKFLLGDWNDDIDDVDEDYTSPIDSLDELIVLSDTIKGAFQREPEAYQQVQNALPPDSQAGLQTVFATAEALRSQAALQAASQQS